MRPWPRSLLHVRTASCLGCRPAACFLRFATEHGDSHCMSVGMPFVFLNTSKARQCLMEKTWEGYLVFLNVFDCVSATKSKKMPVFGAVSSYGGRVPQVRLARRQHPQPRLKSRDTGSRSAYLCLDGWAVVVQIK